MAASKYLPIYLNDHLAGAVAAVQLTRRAARANEGSPYGEPLARLADEINDDRHALQDLLKQLGYGGDPLKLVGAVVAEKLGRLKLNGELLGYSPLSRLEELEILALGVNGKLALWRSLRETLADDPRAADHDFDELIKRATSQRRRLERLRTKAAAEALAASRPG